MTIISDITECLTTNVKNNYFTAPNVLTSHEICQLQQANLKAHKYSKLFNNNNFLTAISTYCSPFSH